MSQQINLYEDRLRPRHELSTGINVGLCALVLLALMAGLSIWTNAEAKRKVEAAELVKKDLSTAQEELTRLTKLMAERKVSPALISERDSIKAVLAQRQEIMAVLDSGSLGNTSGFSAVMTGFARQTTADLWLTGFSVTMGGEAIEIHGRMLDPARLPGYVQSLSGEAVFQGRRFAALEMQNVEPTEPKENPAPAVKVADGGAQQVAQAKLPRFLEFVLHSEDAAMSGAARTGAKP